MSSKKAMKLAQKQAYAKHRSNITNTKFGEKKYMIIKTIFCLKKIQNSYMSSKKAMKLAQKQAFAKHRSNITNTKFGSKKLNFVKKLNKTNLISKKS